MRTRVPVVVERVMDWHRPILWWYRKLGHPVRYLHTSPQAMRWVDRAAWFARLELRDPVHWGHHSGSDLAFAVVDRSYMPWASHPLILHMVRHYASPDLHLAFKKSLCSELERHAYYVLLRHRISETMAGVRNWVFIPSAPHDDDLSPSHEALVSALGALSQTVTRPRWINALAYLQHLKERLTWAMLALTALGEALVGVMGGGRRSGRQHWTYGVAIVAPAREFTNDIRGVGFLLDSRRICARNTVFIPLVPVPRGAVKGLREKGLEVAVMNGGTTSCLPAIIRGVLNVIRFTFAEPWLTRAAAHLLREYGRWQAFLSRYHVDHLITYADFSIRHIGRNILLQRDGTTTWYYADSVNTADTLSRNPHKNSAWGWLYYDNFVSWCDRFSRYFQIHPQRIGRYIELGCLWSEHIRLLKAGILPSKLQQDLRFPRTSRIVAVFDSTYRDDTATTYHDGAEFARGILRLLEERPDICVLWKEKKPRNYHHGRDAGELMAAYDSLARHPRCLFTGHKISASEPLAICELAIAFPFTSPTLEALGARVKAIYYDSVGKFRDSYYASIEGLVVHGFDELRTRVDSFLDHTTQEDYDEYLDNHIKGTIDPYLDGLALSRFRALLAGDGAPGLSPTKVAL